MRINVSNIYFKQLKKSWIFYFVILLFLIINEVVLIIINIFNGGFTFNSYYYIVCMFTTMLLRIMSLVFLVSSNNLRNSMDFDLITMSVSKNKIFWSKTLVIFIIEFISVLLNCTMALITSFSFKNTSSETTMLFLSTFFGELLLSIFFIFLFLLVSYRTKYLTSTIINFLICLALPATSIVSHVLSSNSNNNSIKYNSNQKYQYQNISILDSNNNIKEQYFAIKDNLTIYEYSENFNSDFNNSINSTPFWTNLMIGDWFLSPFYSISKNHLDYNLVTNIVRNSNLNGFNGMPVRFKLVETKLNNNANNFVSNNNLEHTNIFELNRDGLKNSLLNVLNYLTNSNQYIDLKSQSAINTLKSKLDSNSLWTKELFNDNEINTVLAIYGYLNSDKTHLMHYLYKNKNYFNQILPDINSIIETNYSKELSDLIQYLFFDPKAIWNIESYQQLIDIQKIDQMYGSLVIKSGTQKALESDIYFVKNEYLKFQENNKVHILSNNLSYNSYDISILSNINSSIIDQKSWISYVDNNILNLNDLDKLVNNIIAIDNNIYQFNTSDNYFNLNSYIYFGKPIQIGWLSWTDYAFAFYFLILSFTSYLSWKYSVNKQYK